MIFAVKILSFHRGQLFVSSYSDSKSSMSDFDCGSANNMRGSNTEAIFEGCIMANVVVETFGVDATVVVVEAIVVVVFVVVDPVVDSVVVVEVEGGSEITSVLLIMIIVRLFSLFSSSIKCSLLVVLNKSMTWLSSSICKVEGSVLVCVADVEDIMVE